MNVVWIILGVLALYCLGAALLEVKRCRATHSKFGRCTRQPGHWPHMHAGRAGGQWR